MSSAAYPTLYDATHKSINYSHPSIMSMGSCQNLVGQLEHHAPTTDGSFPVCVASGSGIFIKKGLLDSIPAEHRPALDTSTAGQSVQFLMCDSQKSLGTVLLPFLIPKESGGKARIVARVIVLQNLLMGMFIGGYGSEPEDIVTHAAYGAEEIIFDFKTDEPGKNFKVKGVVTV